MFLPDWPVVEKARDLMGHYSLSFWDALIVAACLEAGVDRLDTENFSGYPTIEGLEIVNPFVGSGTP